MVPLLKLLSLCKDFRSGGHAYGKRVRALDRVDLDVYPGDTLGLVGESGCGKTTLARCALRLTEPTSGTVHFDGLDLTSLPPEALRRKRREFQMIFQDSFASLDPRMSVGEIIGEPLVAHGVGTRNERMRRVRELLEAVALDKGLADCRPAMLSGGQQQRVGIARALALKPRLIVADEPVSALDASVQAQVLNLLAELRKSLGLTLMVISHSLHVVRYLCTRVAIMYLGRIVEEIPAAELFHEARHPYSVMLLGSMPALDPTPRLTEQPAFGEVPSAVTRPSGCAFHPRCPKAFTQCKEHTPELVDDGRGKRVACFLFD